MMQPGEANRFSMLSKAVAAQRTRLHSLAKVLRPKDSATDQRDRVGYLMVLPYILHIASIPRLSARLRLRSYLSSLEHLRADEVGWLGQHQALAHRSVDLACTRQHALLLADPHSVAVGRRSRFGPVTQSEDSCTSILPRELLYAGRRLRRSGHDSLAAVVRK